uniref:DUF4258 domain-containing protein n=1 Tax=Strongyloides venezuelensis TaxID=75913 RepID=A0A0K0G0Q2_STRVS
MNTAKEIRNILEITRVELTHHSENDDKQGILECLGRLRQILGRDVEEAVRLVNDGLVKIVQDASSGRKIVRVTSRSDSKIYHLFPRINYCQCPEYKEFVIGSKTKFMVCFFYVYLSVVNSQAYYINWIQRNTIDSY